jgi:hypothetical protein
MTLEQATMAFVFAVFVAAEVYRCVRGRRGTIVEFDEPGLGLIPAMVVTVRVKMPEGNEITAELSGCTVCLGRLRVGDEVRVVSSSKGHSIDLPWFRTGKTAQADCRERVCRGPVIRAA